ncbi:MAG: RNA polymerase subunit sigma-24 [Myxococcaceae bacterium]|nr:RNA polymerase subunit sigma-24 [Myxococcaceae bacterium]MCI0669647.1 RNA polymerase subunit sigma-24 [Myxococcaceae bacterium]
MRLTGSIDAAEGIVQDAFLTALERWPTRGMPRNPGAWLMTAARRRALDWRRRRRTAESRKALLQVEAEQEVGLSMDEHDASTRELADDRLRLIFTCCHPVLTRESQVALTLQLLGGLSTPEVARAFLATESTMAQRLVRAKRTLEEKHVPYVVPRGTELAERLPAVLGVVYLIFNEGYSASRGEALVRQELVSDALRLGELLAELMPRESEVLGLLALMELHASRAAARVTPEGRLVLLSEQDRRLWDRDRVARGLAVLEEAATLGEPGPYQLQARIAACHAHAPSWEETDWRHIVSLYEALVEETPSAVVRLNHAAAVSMAEGPAAALPLLDALAEEKLLAGYHLLPATRADVLRRLERFEEASTEYRNALRLVGTAPEREFLEARLRSCEAARKSRLH